MVKCWCQDFFHSLALRISSTPDPYIPRDSNHLSNVCLLCLVSGESLWMKVPVGEFELDTLGRVNAQRTKIMYVDEVLAGIVAEPQLHIDFVRCYQG